MAVPNIRRQVLSALACAFASLASPASGKPVHLEQVKMELIREFVRCTHCHVGDNNTTLTPYGRQIAELGTDDPVPDRVRRQEEEPSQTASEERRRLEAPRTDIDGDGIANWVEILAGTDPSTAGERNDTHDRIERVISCKLCHTSVSRFPIPGKERAPHNAFGDALENLARNRKAGKRRPPPDEDAPPEPIAPRLHKLARRDTDHDRIGNWDEIRTFHHPADPTDTPSPDETKNPRRRERRRPKNPFPCNAPTRSNLRP